MKHMEQPTHYIVEIDNAFLCKIVAHDDPQICSNKQVCIFTCGFLRHQRKRVPRTFMRLAEVKCHCGRLCVPMVPWAITRTMNWLDGVGLRKEHSPRLVYVTFSLIWALSSGCTLQARHFCFCIVLGIAIPHFDVQ